MFGEVAEKGKCVVFGRGEEVWFLDGLLSPAKATEKALVGGKARIKVSSALGELPALGFKFEVL